MTNLTANQIIALERKIHFISALSNGWLIFGGFGALVHGHFNGYIEAAIIYGVVLAVLFVFAWFAWLFVAWRYGRDLLPVLRSVREYIDRQRRCGRVASLGMLENQVELALDEARSGR
jgi:hypothetical protein